jgi:hypothetical protein
MELTVISILKSWLKDKGYDGLYNDDLDCGCFIEDIMPCCSYSGACLPGVKKFVQDDEYFDERTLILGSKDTPDD